jgi:hypothetical protein
MLRMVHERDQWHGELEAPIFRCRWAGAKVGRACPVNLTTRDFPSKSSEGRQPELFPAVNPAMLGNHDTHHGPNFHLEFLGSAFLGIWRHVSQQGRRHCHVAVGLADGDNAKLIGAIARHLERDRGRIRFVVLPVDDLEQSAKALEQRRADLAVIRSDIAIPQNGATNMIGSRTGSPAA